MTSSKPPRTAKTPIPRLVLGVLIKDRAGHVVWGTNTWHTKQVAEQVKIGERVEFEVPFNCSIGVGSYSITPALVSSESIHEQTFEWIDNSLVFDVVNTEHTFFVGSNWLNAPFEIVRTPPGLRD